MTQASIKSGPSIFDRAGVIRYWFGTGSSGGESNQGALFQIGRLRNHGTPSLCTFLKKALQFLENQPTVHVSHKSHSVNFCYTIYVCIDASRQASHRGSRGSAGGDC
jgi:hypothetical protein